jgi:hypothetical protein
MKAPETPEIEAYFFVTDIEMSLDDAIYMAGVYMDHHLEDDRQASVGKLDRDGNILWLKAIGGFNDPIPVDVTELRDGGIVVAISDYRETETFPREILEQSSILVKLSDTGDILLRRKSAGGLISPKQIIETSSGNLLFTGSYKGSTREQSSTLLVMIDIGGNNLWQKTLTLLDYTWARSVDEGPGGEILLAGETGGYGSSLLWPYHDSKAIFARMTGTADIQGECGPLGESLFLQTDMALTVADVSLLPNEETVTIEDSAVVLTDADVAFDYVCPR